MGAEPTYISKDALFTARSLPEEDVEIPGRGTVRVRACTRAEVQAFHKAAGGDSGEAERLTLAAGLVAPKITSGEARLWQEASPAGELRPVVAAITRLSGMDEGAAKEAVKTFRDGPGA